MLVDNINFLRDKFPHIREKLMAVEENQIGKFLIEQGRKGKNTLLYRNNGKEIYLHSKYDPIREAETIITDYQGTENKNVIFYGTGLGYHIDLFVKQNPNNSFYIFEPVEELMLYFLSIQNLNKPEYKNLKNITVGMDDLSKDIKHFLDLNRKDTVIIQLPVHMQVFPEEYEKFNEIFLGILKSKRSDLAVNYSFQERWIINSMKNFKYVLSTPNILLEKKGAFKNIPALLVAAGPSLNEEIENIRYIKEKGLAYIFSVGSAINTLLHHNIYPHAATTYDPTKNSEKVFAKVKEQGIKDIPLIFGSSVAYEVLETYPGPMYHMITSQDKVAHYYLDAASNEEILIVLDAPTIAAVTLQLLSFLGFAPIILVGQNLAYLGQHRHSDGIDYSRKLTEKDLKKALWVEDVYGNKIRTNEGFNRMRAEMEVYISRMEKGRIINTTKGGAKIKGAEFRELKDIITKDLKQDVVRENWLAGNKTDYSMEALQTKSEAMDHALTESYKWVREYNEVLEKMYALARNRNYKQLDFMYSKLNTCIHALETNVFFITFILQINRVQHQLLANTIKSLEGEKDFNKKHLGVLQAYKKFIDKCRQDMEKIKPVYEEMKRAIYSPKKQILL